MEYELQSSPILRTSKSVFPGGVEGKWTPVLTFTTPGDLVVGYASQFGYFSRIGSFVTVYFQIVTIVFTHSTASGNLRLTDLPFRPRPAETSAFPFSMGNLRWDGITKAGYTDLIPLPVVSANVIQFSASGSGLANTGILAADVPSGGNVLLAGGITYQAEEQS